MCHLQVIYLLLHGHLAVAINCKTASKFSHFGAFDCSAFDPDNCPIKVS